MARWRSPTVLTHILCTRDPVFTCTRNDEAVFIVCVGSSCSGHRAWGTSPGTMPGTGDPDNKLYIGGLSVETSNETLSSHFRKYGELADCIVMLDKPSNRSRGFGFVTFKDASSMHAALGTSNVIDGRDVSVKKDSASQGSRGGVCFHTGAPSLSTVTHAHESHPPEIARQRTRPWHNRPHHTFHFTVVLRFSSCGPLPLKHGV